MQRKSFLIHSALVEGPSDYYGSSAPWLKFNESINKDETLVTQLRDSNRRSSGALILLQMAKLRTVEE